MLVTPQSQIKRGPGQPIRHGHARGGRNTQVYVAWRSMIRRCSNTKHRSYRNYGGRGITVCRRWRESFEAFLADMGEPPSRKHSLDRFPDNDGHYEPGNCRWATSAEQKRNSRRAKNITHDGKTMCLTDWAIQIGIKPNTLAVRLLHGWSVERALSIPVKAVPE